MSILDSIANEAPVARESAAAEPEQPTTETTTTDIVDHATPESPNPDQAATENNNSAEQPNAPEAAPTETQAPQNLFANEEVAKFNDFV